MRHIIRSLVVLLFLNVSLIQAQEVLFEQPPIRFDGMATQPISFASTVDVNDETVPNRGL